MSTKFNKTIFTIMLVLMMATALAGSAQAVHDDDLFQLDYVANTQGVANVSSTNISPDGNTGDDWDKVYNGTSAAFATAFIPDPVGAAETSFYTGGGSKDERPISTGNQHWEWDDTNDVIPDKDDISNAFAAAYIEPDTGHTIFYFGADRFDTNGDAEIGFWFFRQPVTLGTKPNFIGEHEVGDILVLANWGGSNKVGDIAVYEWVGGNKPLQLLLDTAQADCSVAPADDPVCAVVNNIGGETPPWSYTNKDGQHSYKASALFEGGIDVNALLGVEEIGCFSSFLAATRSSHSTDAQLKDFALGAFPVCGIEVTKTGDTLSKVGDPANYTVTIHNTGRATLYMRDISDTVFGSIADEGAVSNQYLTSNSCGVSLSPNDDAPGGADECTMTFTRIVQAGDPDPLPNTVSILYSEKANFTGSEFTAESSHAVNLFQPAVMITKTGDSLSKATDPVTYTFTIENKSSQDSPNLTLVSINDNVIGNLANQANAAGCDVLTYNETCSFNVTRTVGGGDPDPLINTVNVLYNPVGFPNQITASDGHSVNLFQPSVSITKNGDTLSKIGDSVTYKVTINNTSSSDSPSLILDSIVDDVLGDLSDEAPASCDSIAPGASCEFEVPWTVTTVDVNPADGQADDPVINTVTIHFHPQGFPNDITATASHELNLFQPSIAFNKTADTQLSKATDDVNYTLTLNNTSSPDTPDLVCTITDAKLGVNKQVTLASGAGDVTNVPYTVKAGDPDPLVNNASVSCSPTGFPNVLNASSSWTVNLFQPSVEIVKGGDTLSKEGDTVTYTFMITNTSSGDSPNLMLVGINDSLLGDLGAAATLAGCDNLAPGASCNFTVDRTVQAGDPDPLPNTVDVHYNPSGFPNDIADSDGHSVNLFQPAIAFTKSGDKLSKVGDTVNYTLTLYNNSSSDSPDLNCTITDTTLGYNKQTTIAAGTIQTFNLAYTVQAGDPDPLTNTAGVTCSPSGFPNVLTAGASQEVNLFQPSVKVTKTGPAYSKAGDTATFTVKIENTSSADSPDLVLDSFSDSLVSGVTPPASCSPLASGASCMFSYNYVVQAGDDDPLVNTATVHYHPTNFPNDITDSSTWNTTLLHPNFTATKVCKADTEPIPQEGPALFTVTFQNTGDADLVVDADDGIGIFNLAIGETKSFEVSVPGPFSGQSTVSNTVTGTVTLNEKYGLDNSYSFSASDSCDVGSRVELLKQTNGVVDPTYDWDFAIWDGPHYGDPSSWLNDQPLATDSTLGDADGILTFGLLNLDPTKTYTICELATNASAGWTQLWTINGVTVPAYNPGQFDNPMQSLGYSCIDFGAGTGYELTAGETLRIELDNDFPGGEPRTPGYWKNWNSCTGGGQYPKTIDANDPNNEFWSLDELLNNPGFDIGLMHVDGIWNNDKYTFQNAPYNNDCIESVRILDKSDAASGKKQANDAAYELATAYFASMLNYAAGAEQCPAAAQAQLDAQTLLLSIGFDGDGTFLGSKVKGPLLTTRNQALQLAKTLDLYNNGLLCSP